MNNHIFCAKCDKAKRYKALEYHQDICRDWQAGYDCMCLEFVEFCRCHMVKA